MKDLYKRFNVGVDLNDARVKFKNKINNILFDGAAFNNDKFEIKNLDWDFCNEIGIRYSSIPSFENSYFNPDLSFDDFLLRLQCLLNILNNKEHKEQWGVLVSTIEDAIAESPLDLGIRLKRVKKKDAQIHLAGSKLLDEVLVDDVLGVLEGKEKQAIKMIFEKGLNELFEARKDPSKLKNVFRDMQLACDELMKHIFQDKNIGLKHMFKDNRWEKMGLNEYQRSIFYTFNEQLDKLAKHRAISPLDRNDAENTVYLTGLLIRLAVLKSGK